tara:strand:+ start:6009 stop:6224 length:216 start_codon:yes stop_codon:yes gene_type:complete
MARLEITELQHPYARESRHVIGNIFPEMADEDRAGVAPYYRGARRFPRGDLQHDPISQRRCMDRFAQGLAR